MIGYAGWPAMAYASVDLPEPFGPMIACTSPEETVRFDALYDRRAVLQSDVQILQLQCCHVVDSSGLVNKRIRSFGFRSQS